MPTRKRLYGNSFSRNSKRRKSKRNYRKYSLKGGSNSIPISSTRIVNRFAKSAANKAANGKSKNSTTLQGSSSQLYEDGTTL